MASIPSNEKTGQDPNFKTTSREILAENGQFFIYFKKIIFFTTIERGT